VKITKIDLENMCTSLEYIFGLLLSTVAIQKCSFRVRVTRSRIKYGFIVTWYSMKSCSIIDTKYPAEGKGKRNEKW
jgi:hypothetical protein